MTTKITAMIPTKGRTLKKFCTNLKEHPTEIINYQEKKEMPLTKNKQTKKKKIQKIKTVAHMQTGI